MKTFTKYSLIVGIIFCSINAYSQIEKPITKGNMILGGLVGFYYYHDNQFETQDLENYIEDGKFELKSREFSFGLSPVFGFFVSDGLLLGASVGIYYSNYKASYNHTWPTGNYKYEYLNNSYRIVISPFIKYYFKKGIFFEFDLGYAMPINKSNQELDDEKYSTDNTAHAISISSGFGYAFFIKPKISFEPGLYYEYGIDFEKGNQRDYTYTSTNYSHNIYLKAGFHYFF